MSVAELLVMPAGMLWCLIRSLHYGIGLLAVVAFISMLVMLGYGSVRRLVFACVIAALNSMFCYGLLIALARS